MKQYAHPALLLPGIGGGSVSLLPLQRSLRRDGIFAKRFPAPLVLTRSVADYASAVRTRVRKMAEAAGAPIALFGWSLGGLIAVDAMGDPGMDGLVRAVISFGSPFDGTVAGHAGFLFSLSFLRGAKEVVPGSAALARVRGIANDPSRSWRFAAVNGRLDPLAPFPQRSIRPDTAVNGAWTHLAPLSNRALHALIATLVKRL